MCFRESYCSRMPRLGPAGKERPSDPEPIIYNFDLP